MEGELWKDVRSIVTELGKRYHSKRKQYSDAEVVLVYLWAVLHDRPVCWACCLQNWWPWQRRRRLPSSATMSRRLRSEPIRVFLKAIEQQLRSRFPSSWCKWIDALPLPVGGSTQDRDAKYGRAASTMAKGYKLYAICDSKAGIEAWQVYGMNVNEKRVGLELVAQTDSEGYLVGDGEYHSTPLFDAAAEAGLQLVSRKPAGRGLGHRRQSVHRLRGLDLLSRPFGKALLESRGGIERFFGQWGNFGAGLKPLPHWVRTLPRVRLWMQGKIIFNAVRLVQKQQGAA